MKFNIRGDKVKITKPINEYVINKIGKLEKYLKDTNNITINVLIKIRGVEQIVEVTINIGKLILRAEERHKDLYAAIDLVSEKLERQIRKNKTRMLKKQTNESIKGFIMDFDVESCELDKQKVIKRKEVEMKPMSEEEAILQMNLIDHDFFVYKDAKINQICIVYKRKDGNYGVITTN